MPRSTPRRKPVEPAFDDHHQPDPALIADCVHCGFCLPACPTYALWGEEMDSPRGRILLMDLAQRHELPMSEEVVSHWDACLGCMACVPACPSGVAYDHLLAQTRQQVERRFKRPLSDRIWREGLFLVLPHPLVLRGLSSALWAAEAMGLRDLAAGPLKHASPRLRAAARLAPHATLRQLWRRLPAPRPSASGSKPKLRVAILGGCVQRVMEPHVNQATALVLSAYGAEVSVPSGQGCCGALELHAGREAVALKRARRLIAKFDDPAVDRVAINAAGCGAMLRDLGRLLADDPAWAKRAEALSAKVRDVSEVLDELGPPDSLQPVPRRVAYHDACHLRHAQGVWEAPRRVLSAIPDLEILEVPDGELCCGSAGTYNLTEPEAAHDLGLRKAENIRSVAPDCLAAGNPGCLLQLRAALDEIGFPLPAYHPVELVAASLLGTPPPGPA